MDGSQSVFAHKDQQHLNKKHYNRKSCIPSTKRAWNFRNGLWSIKYCKSALKCCLLLSVFQSGANTLEAIHAAFKLWFPWIKHDKAGLHRILAWIMCSTLKNNSKKSQLLIKKSQKNQQLPISKEIINKLSYIYLCGQRLQDIDESNSVLPVQDINGHGIMYFDDIHKEINLAKSGSVYLFKHSS